MDVIDLILLIIAAVCFAFAALAHAQPARVNLVALGLLAWVLVPLIDAAQALD